MGAIESQFESRPDGIGFKMEDSSHFTAHTKSATVAHIMRIAHALRRTASVGKDKIGYPAVLAKVQFLHVTQPGDAVHDRVAGFLIAYDGFDELISGLLIQFEVFRSLKRCMEVERYRGDMRIVAHVIQRGYEAVLIERIEHHIHADVLASGLSDMFLESGESTFAANLVMPRTYSIHGHPHLVGVAAVEGELCVGGNGCGEKAYSMRQVDDIVNAVIGSGGVVVPQIEFAALEVHKAATEVIAIAQFFLYLFERLRARISQLIDGAVFTTKITAIQDKDDGLQGFLPAEYHCLEVPPY